MFLIHPVVKHWTILFLFSHRIQLICPMVKHLQVLLQQGQFHSPMIKHWMMLLMGMILYPDVNVLPERVEKPSCLAT